MSDVDRSITELNKVISLLKELKNYRMIGKCPEEIGVQREAWRLADLPPEEKVVVYITADRKEQGDRILLEGFYENNAWFDDEGRSLEHPAIKVIAWMPKLIPEPCKKNMCTLPQL